MARLRTYRTLPLLVGLVLLVGAAAPTMQVACGMRAGGLEVMDPACHEPEADHSTPASTLDRTDSPCDGDVSATYHWCCSMDGTPASSAALLSDASARFMDPVHANVRPAAPPPSTAQPALLPAAKTLSAFITASPLRQALLATFLI